MANKRYQLGDKFSLNFDYDGMLLYAMNTTLDTSVNDLEKLLDSFEDVNYHREAAPLYDLIEHIKYQNEYGANEVTRENINESLLAFRKEVQDTMKIFEKWLMKEKKSSITKVIGVFGGRFQPFGPHHKKVYDWLKRQFDDENTIENNAPNLLDDYNEMIRLFNKEQAEEKEKLTIDDIRELVKSIPNDAKLGEYIRKRI